MNEAPNRIRELRMQAGLSQQKLADRVGCSKMTISELERGHMKLDTHYMRRLAAALDVLAADLLPVADNPDGLSVEERRLINQLRAATPEQREQMHRVSEALMPFRAGPADPAKFRKSAA